MPALSDRSEAAYDSFENVPELSGLREAVDGGDASGASAVLERMSPDEAAYALGLLARREGVEGFLEHWVADGDATGFGRVALAARYVVKGWLVRSGDETESVSSEQFAEFRAWIVRAEQLLIEACARRAELAPAWGLRVLTARALQVGPSEATRRYERLRALSPHDYPAQAHMLQYLLPKWFGSNDEAYTFARRALDAAPPGTNSGALIPAFHIERWLELGAGWPGKEYMTQTVVLDELKDAAARSVLHPAHRPGPIGVEAHSAFAMAYYLAGKEDEAALHMQIVSGRASEFPWNYTLTDTSELATVRRTLLRRVVWREAR